MAKIWSKVEFNKNFKITITEKELKEPKETIIKRAVIDAVRNENYDSKSSQILVRNMYKIKVLEVVKKGYDRFLLCKIEK